MNPRAIIGRSVHDVVEVEDTLVVIHSSMPLLGPPSGVRKWDWLFVLDELVRSGKTLAIPAFTFSFCSGQSYHFRDSASEVGILGEWALELNGAKRTAHPIYSFVVVGPLADELCAARNSTTFGPDSSFSLFDKHNARIVMLGCGWEYCTYFHKFEEEQNVPYRYFKTFTGEADFGQGATQASAEMFVRDLELDPANDFSDIPRRLRESGKLKETQLWKGTVASASCQDIADVAVELLESNPWHMVHDYRQKLHLAKSIAKAKSAPPLKVALLGSSNLELVKESMEKVCKDAISDQRVELHTVPYGQLFQQILDPASELRKFQADTTFFADRLEDVLGVYSLEEADLERALEKVRQFVSLIEEYRDNVAGPIVVNRFFPSVHSTMGLADQASGAGSSALVAQSNQLLSALADKVDGIRLFSVDAPLADTSSVGITDSRLWFLGRFPFSSSFSEYLAHRYLGTLLVTTGRTCRLIAVDLDNTLWGGVLGEDGKSGIRLGGDYPGNIYASFQRVLKQLSERGIALVICSKNDDALALDAITTLDAMVLTADDFVARKINWKPKWQNISDVCKELNLGLANVLFIDDNPVEREQVRQFLPDVKVLELPDDPSYYGESLLASPWIECWSVTSEDSVRNKNYRARELLLEDRASFQNLDEFYANLGLKVTLSSLSSANLDRATQLVNKTNQFNATTRRYNKEQLAAFDEDGGEVIVIGCQDKYSDYEIIGVLLLKHEHPDPGWITVDNYLLSCRALGKGLESGVLAWLLQEQKEAGAVGVIGEIVVTERNEPVRQIYSDSGFKNHKSADTWIAPLAEMRVSVPAWLSISNELKQSSLA